MSELTPHERLHAWEELEQNNAWKEFLNVLHAQVSARESELLEGTTTPENIYDREKMRGERSGLKLALVIAGELHELAAQDVKLQSKESDDVQENAAPPL